MIAYLELFGARPLTACVYVPEHGVWIARVEIDAEAKVDLAPYAAVLRIGETTFTGTYDEARSGTFGFKRYVQIVGGANGWGRELPARGFHNDAGIKLSTILKASSDAAGERLSLDPALAATRIGTHFERIPGPASAVLKRYAPAGWVDYDGTTQIRARTSPEATNYDLLDFDPGANIAELGVFDPKTVQVGSVLTGRLDRQFRTRSLTISVDADRARVYAWGR